MNSNVSTVAPSKNIVLCIPPKNPLPPSEKGTVTGYVPNRKKLRNERLVKSIQLVCIQKRDGIVEKTVEQEISVDKFVDTPTPSARRISETSVHKYTDTAPRFIKSEHLCFLSITFPNVGQFQQKIYHCVRYEFFIPASWQQCFAQ